MCIVVVEGSMSTTPKGRSPWKIRKNASTLGPSALSLVNQLVLLFGDSDEHNKLDNTVRLIKSQVEGNWRSRIERNRKEKEKTDREAEREEERREIECSAI